LHPRIPQKSNATITFFEGKGAHGLPQEVSIHEGLQTFAGPTKWSAHAFQIRSTWRVIREK
jgi:hypothetical protein